jgi:hypothetical protein
MNPFHTFPNRARAGLTFLELLLAVSISGLIMAASTQLMFSFAHFWMQSEQDPRFSHHVDGVVSLLQFCLDESEELSTKTPARFDWKRPPEGKRPALHFRQKAALPLFVSEIQPPPEVDAWIEFDEDEGLSLLWHVPAALTEGKIKLLRTPVSHWVEDVQIGYLDTTKNLWEYESCADDKFSARKPPEALRILFNQNGRTQTRYIRMQRQDRHVLIY